MAQQEKDAQVMAKAAAMAARSTSEYLRGGVPAAQAAAVTLTLALALTHGNPNPDPWKPQP